MEKYGALGLALPCTLFNFFANLGGKTTTSSILLQTALHTLVMGSRRLNLLVTILHGMSMNLEYLTRTPFHNEYS
jgi:hypothetical protein